VPLLEIPLNYYDDLAARFDFTDEFLSELAYFNVLYDRDAQGGELFHVYTEPFEERFFFEIIQRKGGYAGVRRGERGGAPGGDGQAAQWGGA
jgi:4-hydroxyphenylpyruvate dioxygenase (EC 1.13.11.27)